MNHIRFLEQCAGSAAVSLSIFGVAPLSPYLGGKRQYAARILAEMGLDVEPGPLFPSQIDVFLVDPGPWGRVWELVASGHLSGASEVVKSWESDGRRLFDQIVSLNVPADPCAWLASFLALQSSTVLSKEIVECAGRWKTSGYASLSKLAVEKGFKERLLRASLVQRMERVHVAVSKRIQARQANAESGVFSGVPTHVLIDPPYKGTLGYSHGFSRGDVVECALSWRLQGCVVAVCEHEPTPALIDSGFVSVDISESRTGWQVRNKSKSVSEFLTVWRPQ